MFSRESLGRGTTQDRIYYNFNFQLHFPWEFNSRFYRLADGHVAFSEPFLSLSLYVGVPHTYRLSICISLYTVVYILSGQIIATSHDLTPNGGLVMEFPLFQGNLSW